MQNVRVEGFDQLNNKIDNFLERKDDLRREMHEEIGRELKKLVDSEISSSGLNSSEVQSWQEARVGSGGGYAAISPAKGNAAQTKRRGKKSYAKGYITNALESGHRTRPPSEGHVQGYHFYFGASAQAEARAIQAAERFADRIAEALT